MYQITSAMKQLNGRHILWALLITLTLGACKSKQNDTGPATSTPDTTTTVATPAPVQISPDDSLRTGVRDATKDYPGVNATVENGEITLTGNIKRDRLTPLMQSLHSLHPKKINNKLTIQ